MSRNWVSFVVSRVVSICCQICPNVNRGDSARWVSRYLFCLIIEQGSLVNGFEILYGVIVLKCPCGREGTNGHPVPQFNKL